MLTIGQVLEAIKAGRESECLDGRDYGRLTNFFLVEDWPTLGFTLKEGKEAPEPRPWTQEEVISQLRLDVDFGFKKALGRRGISASFMYSTVKMWMWVLEDDLQHMEEYAQYGLPLFKAVAVKYGFDNPIGEDNGDEYEYSSGYGEY